MTENIPTPLELHEPDLLEQRTREAEQTIRDTELRLLRTQVADRHGISITDRDLLLTGTDEATLNLQAARLAERWGLNRTGPVVPREGDTKHTGKPADENIQEFTRELFGRSGDGAWW